MANNVREGDADNIRLFKQTPKIHISAIIFFCLLLYVIVVMVIYFSEKHTVRYEVVEGSLATSTIYRGVVLREERIIGNSEAGYVNFLAREGQRVAVGDLVYTVDETGSLNKILEAGNLGENSLSDRELSDFRSEIVDYVHSYDSSEYDSIYDFKYSIKNTVLKLANTKLLQNIDSASDVNGLSSGIKYCYAGASGIISYWTDGYEELSAEDITKEVFDNKKYEKNTILGNQLRAQGETIYKLSGSEDWSIVFPIEQAVGEALLEEDYIKVRFLKNQNESWGKVHLLNNADGTYLQLSFNNSMVSFVGERFLDVELCLDDEVGLKIPISSIVEKEFFLIDGDYVFENEDDRTFVLMQTFNENGERTQSNVFLDVYSYNEDTNFYYIDDSYLSAGDILYKANGMDTYVVKSRGTLTGVYNINKGYADFKEITIRLQNDEYAIVKSNTKYGLRVYDYIALDATSVDDDQFINQ